MPILSKDYVTLIAVFAPVFSRRVWQHVQVLLAGAILAPGRRTVTALLRVMGLSDERHFQTYHRVLNRAVWSSLEVSRILLGILVCTFAATGTIVLGLDETIERRWGAKIKARGIYRDPVRSSRSHFVKASGLRWMSLMLLVRILQTLKYGEIVGKDLYVLGIREIFASTAWVIHSTENLG